MTHDYKGTLDALNKWNCIDRRLNHKAREFGRDQAELFLECNLETIRSALKLAQETEQLRLKLSETAIHLAARNSEIEQLRKERDEFERKLKDRSEWFFRWIARGKAGYAGMSMETCADMIWHHPDNPYSENNPWSELTKKVAGE